MAPRSARCGALNAGACRPPRSAKHHQRGRACRLRPARRADPALDLRRPPRGREPGPVAVRPHPRRPSARRLEAAQPCNRPRLPRAGPDRAVGQRHPAHEHRLPRGGARRPGVRGAGDAIPGHHHRRADRASVLDDTDQTIMETLAGERGAPPARSPRRSACRPAPRARGWPASSDVGSCARLAPGRRIPSGDTSWPSEDRHEPDPRTARPPRHRCRARGRGLDRPGPRGR